jgi:hypothetical protein
MKKTGFWIAAFLITISTAVYQRVTGPTYPLRGTAAIQDAHLKYRLPRTADTGKDCEFELRVPHPGVSGYVLYRRFKTADKWRKRPLMRKEDVLVGRLPHQPPAGKLAYKVVLESQDKELSLSGSKPIIIRFKGAVPVGVLIPHVIIMFLAMLLSTRAGLEALDRKSNPRKYALWATGLLLVGGLIFGPLVQKFAFGSLWTGFPLGFDLTDNKTLIAMIGWTAAIIAGRKGKPARGWVLGAAILMLVIFLIPHSLLGSELDYSQMNPSS